jgi:hypothetical protein
MVDSEVLRVEGTSKETGPEGLKWGKSYYPRPGVWNSGASDSG